MITCHCGRQWTGLSQAHCTVCHEHFSTVAGFDKHEPSYKGCRKPEKVKDAQGNHFYKASVNHLGTTWVRNIERPDPTDAIKGGIA